MEKFSYVMKDGIKYEVSYYYFVSDQEIYVCKLCQNTENRMSFYYGLATTADEYLIDGAYLFNPNNMINEDEFEKVYAKYKDTFHIDTISTLKF